MSKLVKVHLIELHDQDRCDIDALIAGDPELADAAGPEDLRFQQVASVVAHELPRRLRSGIRDFQLNEPAAVCVVRGVRVDDATIGPTPRTWRSNDIGTDTRREELIFYLIASLLGEPIAWSTKQDGRVMHDIVPVRGHENEQLGSGSDAALTWHTEDGFHPLRADYLGLMCLRNPDAVATTVATLDELRLHTAFAEILRQERFEMLPDGSHFQPVSEGVQERLGDRLIAHGRARLEQMRDRPVPSSILFGSATDPYLRLDEYFARPVAGDKQAEQALSGICRQVSDVLTGYVLTPGDICFIDNYKAVHGRESFRARFDGTDRWLKRLNLARDLRKSRETRASPGSRLIV